MKQDSPIRKKQNYVATEKHFSAIIERSTAPRRISAEAGRRDDDYRIIGWDKARPDSDETVTFAKPEDSPPEPMTEVAKGLITGAGIGGAVFALVLTVLGNYGTMLWYAAISLVCLFMWLWLDADE